MLGAVLQERRPRRESRRDAASYRRIFYNVGSCLVGMPSTARIAARSFRVLLTPLTYIL